MFDLITDIKLGEKFGKWIVNMKTESKDKKNSYYDCLCTDCNKHHVVVGYSLKNGSSKSCGCKSVFKGNGSAERRNEVRRFLKKGYTSREILANIRTSFSMITQERKKLRNDKELCQEKD